MAQPTNQERIIALEHKLVSLREEAIKARKESGIEDVWAYCEEAYLGIDAANRGEFAKAKWAKPTSMDGPVMTNRAPSDETKSTAFVRLTSRYVDAGAARVSEIILPPDDKSFSIEETPIPFGAEQPQIDAAMQGVTQADPMAGAQAQPQDPAAAKDEAKTAAKKAETRIFDWMVEAKHTSHMRKVIHDASRIGTGILKGPFPVMRRAMKAQADKTGMKLMIAEKVAPGEAWVDPWNLFPDAACGENIHDGDYVFERDYLTRKKLSELKKQTGVGYIASAIDKVLQEGPDKALLDPNPTNAKVNSKARYTVWYFYGILAVEDFLLLNPSKARLIKPQQKEVFVICTMVNDTVIRAVFNPLDSGRFPYQVLCWSRRAGYWAGVGVAEQIEMPQRMCNAATRAVINNAGKSAGSQIVLDQGVIIPADGKMVIGGGDKIWYKSPDAVMDDVKKAFAVFTVPNLTAQLMPIVEYSFRLAEEASNIPLLAQGQVGARTPETFGAAQIQDNNANTLLRSIGYSVDDDVTEPLVYAYYEWLMLDPDVPEEEKGDFQINAHGSVALVERSIQDQTIQQVGGLVANPAFGIDPKKWFAEYMKSKRLDPRLVQYTEEQMAELAKQPQPEDPRVAVAKINAEAKIKAQEMDSAEARDHAAADAHLAMAEQSFEASEAEKDRQLELLLAQVNERIQAMKEGTAKEISFADLKGMLAATSMKLKEQKDLFLASSRIDLHKHHAPQVTTPPVEPPGRAPAGEAYAK